jgi:hypothetical protein
MMISMLKQTKVLYTVAVAEYSTPGTKRLTRTGVHVLVLVYLKE